MSIHAYISIALLISCMGSLPLRGEAQDRKQPLNAALEPCPRAEAQFFRLFTGVVNGLYMVRIVDRSGNLKAEGSYLDQAMRVPHGRFRFYHPDGKLESEGDYAQGLKAGVWDRYDRWGRQLTARIYDPEPVKEIVYTQARTMPQFPGGEKELVRYLRDRVAMQVSARQEPTAEASFIVEADGRITDVRITRAPSPVVETGLAEALMSSPRWEPGVDNGRQVRVRMRMPIP